MRPSHSSLSDAPEVSVTLPVVYLADDTANSSRYELRLAYRGRFRLVLNLLVSC